jgi:membrane protein implicated in regulation of membrane protease activity
MALWQEWWVWAVAGVVLAILEVIIPGFILLGFAIGALLTASLIWVGLLGGSLAPQLLVFALGALIAWGLLRKIVGVRAGQTKVWDKDINEG